MTNQMQNKVWSIRHLKEAYLRDLAACQTSHERICCTAICGAEIRRYAHAFAAKRKLTPAEIAIASEFGYPAH